MEVRSHNVSQFYNILLFSQINSTDSASRVFIASSTPSSGQATVAAVTAKDVASVDLPFKTTANNYDRFATLRGHTRGIWGMTQLADRRICSAGADNDVRVWNLDLKNCDLVLRGHTKSVGECLNRLQHGMLTCNV